MSAGCGILAIWHDVRPENLQDTLSWYDREHHPERLAVPGFRSVRRYHAVDADRFLFIRYETESPDILSSPAYLARLGNPTPWTQRCQRTFVDNIRSVCTRESREGWAEGGFAVTARLVASGVGSDMPAWSELSRAILARDGVVGAELWRGDRRSSEIATAEKELRGVPDGMIDWGIVIHTTSLIAAQAARDNLLQSDITKRFAVAPGIYALAMASFCNMS